MADKQRWVKSLIHESVEEMVHVWGEARAIEHVNQARVLKAFQEVGVGSHDLQGSSGYGYGDTSREKLEEIYAIVFGGESALVRPQIASGTHALWLCLDALLHPGDHLISVTGAPYDTLRAAIVGDSPHSLLRKGVLFDEVEFAADGEIDLEAVAKRVTERSKLLFVQRSKGYAWRPALRVAQIERLCAWRDQHFPNLIVMVDNCYGEFVEEREPGAVGADVVAGSLIKNPGGTLAPGGGYIVGRDELLRAIGHRMTAPSLGRRIGPSYGITPLLLQGLFLAPHLVIESLCGMRLAARLFERLEFDVLPRWDEPRGDTVQAIRLGTPERLRAFCQAVQQSSPVDSYVHLEPGAPPGYTDPVIMAAGTFVQGSSSELSADGPLRPPYAAYMQGGISRIHVQIALEHVAIRMLALDS